MTDPKLIMTEIYNFYADLYDKDSRESGGLSTDEFLSSINTKMLTDEQRELLDNKITISEYFEALKSFQKNKTPGNDGLTVEFYLGFWHLVGQRMHSQCLKFCSRTGTTIELAETSQ